VGGRTLSEIEQMLIFFADQLKILMVGFQSFPSKLQDIKLAKIADLKERFAAIKIGYADHSAFDHEHAVTSNEYARFLGATVFEKHITLEEGTQRVDSASAISKEKIKLINDKLKFIDSTILLPKDHNWVMTSAEVTYRERQLKCVAATNLPMGTLLNQNDIRLKLVDNQELAFSRIEDLVGKVVSQPLQPDDVITLNLVQ
jgi:N,N'-diacetyllegionaminate synthase